MKYIRSVDYRGWSAVFLVVSGLPPVIPGEMLANISWDITVHSQGTENYEQKQVLHK